MNKLLKMMAKNERNSDEKRSPKVDPTILRQDGKVFLWSL